MVQLKLHAVHSVDTAQGDGTALILSVSYSEAYERNGPNNGVATLIGWGPIAEGGRVVILDDGEPATQTRCLPDDEDPVSYCFRANDPFGIAPQIGAWLKANASSQSAPVKAWVKANL